MKWYDRRMEERMDDEVEEIVVERRDGVVGVTELMSIKDWSSSRAI